LGVLGYVEEGRLPDILANITVAIFRVNEFVGYLEAPIHTWQWGGVVGESQFFGRINALQGCSFS
jgi:hypothetical protein